MRGSLVRAVKQRSEAGTYWKVFGNDQRTLCVYTCKIWQQVPKGNYNSIKPDNVHWSGGQQSFGPVKSFQVLFIYTQFCNNCATHKITLEMKCYKLQQPWTMFLRVQVRIHLSGLKITQFCNGNHNDLSGNKKGYHNSYKMPPTQMQADANKI